MSSPTALPKAARRLLARASTRLPRCLAAFGLLLGCGPQPPAPQPAASPSPPRAIAARPGVDPALPARVAVTALPKLTCDRPECHYLPHLPENASVPSGSPVASVEVEVRAGSRLGFVPAWGDAFITVIDGEVDLRATPWEPALRPFDVAFVPELGFSITPRGGSPSARAIVTFVGAGAKRDVRDGFEVTSRVGHGDFEIPVARFSTIPPLSWGGGRFHARIGIEPGGDVHASVGVLITSGDAKIAEHVHEGSWEHLVVLEGQGTMTLAGQRAPVKAGEAIFIPKGAAHAFEASGGRFVALQIYAPGGPEQRFKALAGK